MEKYLKCMKDYENERWWTKSIRQSGVSYMCDGCEKTISHGSMYACIQCPDYALCSLCFQQRKTNVCKTTKITTQNTLQINSNLQQGSHTLSHKLGKVILP